MARKDSHRQSHDESDMSERMMLGAGPQTTIGDDLRAARMAIGEDLQDIAQQLRIRYPYLEAIENGAFDALPGPTYAIGFVRAYARYLRLDAEEMIARFKEEAAGLDAPAELSFPEPVSESRVPRGGLIVIAILLAAAAYGGWYYLSTRDLTVADLVPAVPSDFLGSPSSETAEVPPDMSPPPAPSSAVAPEPLPQASPAPMQAAESSAPSTVFSTIPEMPMEAAPMPPASAPSPSTGGAASSTANAPAAPPSEPAASQSAAIPAVPTVGDGAASASVDPADAGPRVYGEGNADARIVLRARGDSWVQIRAADDSLVMTRTLRAGDSYRVPNQTGLKLMTGNAGALDIVVDGQETAALGPFGSVRRNIALDPERLKAAVPASN